MQHRSLALALALVAGGGTGSCATLGIGAPTASFADVDALLAGTRIPDDAAAIVLLREEGIHLRGAHTVTTPTTDFTSHEVIKILTEGGFDAAKVRVVIPKDGELLSLAARTISPSGVVTPVLASQMQRTKTVVEGRAGAELRYFQFPKVEVGSVLELVYTTRTTGLFLTWSGGAASQFPIANYIADVSTPPNVKFDFLLNGTTVPLATVPDPDGREHVRAELHDVPPLVPEAFAPRDRTGAPWWIYRVLEIRSVDMNGDVRGVVDWDMAVPNALEDAIIDNTRIAGFDNLSLGTCNRDDVACVVAKALAQTRTKEWTGFDEQLAVRDPAEIEQSSTANNVEKALYLWSALRSAGVDAQLALVERSPGFPVRKSFPSSAWFDHAIVYVAGLGGGTFLDPSCEACAVGQIPEWDRGIEALVAKPKSNKTGVVTEWKPIAGQPLPENSVKIVYDVKIAKSGDVEVDIDEVARGENAAYVRLDTRTATPSEITRSWEDFAKARNGAATVASSTPWTCDREQGRCKRTAKLTIPAYATPDSGRLLVPLELLYSAIEAAVPPNVDPARRTTDVEIARASDFVEELHLRAASGYSFDGVPKGFDEAADFGAASLKSRAGEGEVVVTREGRLALTALPKARFAAVARLIGTYRGARTETVRLVPAK